MVLLTFEVEQAKAKMMEAAVDRKQMQRVGMVAFFILMTLYLGANAYVSVTGWHSSPGWAVSQKSGRVRIAFVLSSSTAAGALQIGDEVVALDGRAVESVRDFIRLMRVAPETSYTLTIQRDGVARDVALRTENLPATETAINRFLFFFIAPLFLVFAAIIYTFKPDDKQAVLLALLFGSFMPSTQPLFHDVLPLAARALMLVGEIATSLFFPLFFHFFLIFPERSPLVRRFPKLERRLFLPCLLVMIPATLAMYISASFASAESAREFSSIQKWLQILMVGAACLYIAAGLVSLLVNYRQANRQSRRRLRVVVVGSLVGLLPCFAFTMYAVTVGFAGMNETLLRWFAAVSLVLLLLFPLSFAYAILRHQVIPVRLIIRRGIRYVLVARGSVVLEILVVGVALFLLLDTSFRYFDARDTFVTGSVSAVFAIIVWHATSFLHHTFIAPAIDRRFFRRAYDAQLLLAELGEALRLTTDLHRMQSIVGSTLQEALQTENVTVLLCDETTHEYRSDLEVCFDKAEHTAFEAKAAARLPGNGAIVERLRASATPIEIAFGDEDSWAGILLRTAEGNENAQMEVETLRRMESVLLVPVRAAHNLLGIISLGARLGDLPFGSEDRRLLAAVALQLAYAVENRELVNRQVAEEGLRREIAMATEVQQRLFPEHAPESPSAEFAGVCFPAHGVGGDYYDFLLLDDERVGVAVADVAGKGISAALLMSTVQASLRSYAPIAASNEAEVTDLIHSMNGLLYGATAANSYATFFYAQFDERTRHLTYVNAGHNPPLLIRKIEDRDARRDVSSHTNRASAFGSSAAAVLEAPTENARSGEQWLTTGGPVIGIFERCDYEQETLALRAGDVLIAYTDGMTEALNPAGEEFGEAQLRDEVSSCVEQSAQEITNCLVAKLRDWCKDTPQHDDITLVVMKVK